MILDITQKFYCLHFFKSYNNLEIFGDLETFLEFQQEDSHRRCIVCYRELLRMRNETCLPHPCKLDWLLLFFEQAWKINGLFPLWVDRFFSLKIVSELKLYNAHRNSSHGIQREFLFRDSRISKHSTVIGKVWLWLLGEKRQVSNIR